MWGKGKIAAALAATAAVASGAWLTASDNAAAALPKVYDDHHASKLHDYQIHAYGRMKIPEFSVEEDFPRVSAQFEQRMKWDPVGFQRYLDTVVRCARQ